MWNPRCHEDESLGGQHLDLGGYRLVTLAEERLRACMGGLSRGEGPDLINAALGPSVLRTVGRELIFAGVSPCGSSGRAPGG